MNTETVTLPNIETLTGTDGQIIFARDLLNNYNVEIMDKQIDRYINGTDQNNKYEYTAEQQLIHNTANQIIIEFPTLAEVKALEANIALRASYKADRIAAVNKGIKKLAKTNNSGKIINYLAVTRKTSVKYLNFGKRLAG